MTSIRLNSGMIVTPGVSYVLHCLEKYDSVRAEDIVRLSAAERGQLRWALVAEGIKQVAVWIDDEVFEWDAIESP